jgi:hypothetical protein
VHSTPVPNMLVQLFAPNYAISNTNAVATDAAGRVAWVVLCRLPGPSGMIVNLESGTPQAVEVASCIEPPPPTPPVPPA